MGEKKGYVNVKDKQCSHFGNVEPAIGDVSGPCSKLLKAVDDCKIKKQIIYFTSN